MNGEVNERMRYVGVDVSKRKCRAAFIDEDGEVVDEFSFRNDFVGISSFSLGFLWVIGLLWSLLVTCGLTCMMLWRSGVLVWSWLIL